MITAKEINRVARIAGQNSIGAMCLRRIHHGEPMVSPETIEGVRQHNNRIVYRDKCGKITNCSEMSIKYGLTNSDLTRLYRDNDNDWRKVAKLLNEPPKRYGDYRDENGKKSNRSEIAEFYGVSTSVVSRAFKIHGADYKAAHKELREKAGL